MVLTRDVLCCALVVVVVFVFLWRARGRPIKLYVVSVGLLYP